LGADERDKGFITFTIVKKEKVANGPIVAFTFERRDGGKMKPYHPGQYLTLRIKKGNYFHNRHYSLVQPFDGKTYRIAIKQEIDQEPKGVVSNEIINNYKEGDQILGTLPAGTFTLIENAKYHLFIAGGIGITVLSSLIQELNKQSKSNTATLIHCVPTEVHAAFASQMRGILPRNQYHLLLQGKRLLQGLVQSTVKPDTHVYVCGSSSFINKVEDYLAECGHPSTHIHMEAFRPSLSLIKNAVKDQSNTKTL
jgi:nitric oxide dioxygenase